MLVGEWQLVHWQDAQVSKGRLRQGYMGSAIYLATGGYQCMGLGQLALLAYVMKPMAEHQWWLLLDVVCSALSQEHAC